MYCEITSSAHAQSPFSHDEYYMKSFSSKLRHHVAALEVTLYFFSSSSSFFSNIFWRITIREYESVLVVRGCSCACGEELPSANMSLSQGVRTQTASPIVGVRGSVCLRRSQWPDIGTNSNFKREELPCVRSYREEQSLFQLYFFTYEYILLDLIYTCIFINYGVRHIYKN